MTELLQLRYHEIRIAMLEYSSHRMIQRIRQLEKSLGGRYRESHNRIGSDRATVNGFVGGLDTARDGGHLSPVLEEIHDPEISQLFRIDDFGSAASPALMDPVRPRPTLVTIVDESASNVASFSAASTQTDSALLEDGNEEENIWNGLDERNTNMAELTGAVEGFIDDTDLDNECNQEMYDVEYEEVTLKRSDGSERLGLTLCYGKGDDVDTDIFISEVEERSIASKDDRIRVGDQILQINGVDVHTRNQAIEQFRQDRNEITLLLARSIANCGEYAQDTTMDDALTEERCCSALREQTPEDEDGHLTDATKGSAGSTHEKDSGISRATDSDPELPPPINSPSKPRIGADDDWLDAASHFASKVALVRPFGDPAGTESEQSSAATPTQANQWMLTGDSDTPKGSLLNYGAAGWKADTEEASFERELRYLNEEIEHIRLTCDRLIEQHAKAENLAATKVQPSCNLQTQQESVDLELTKLLPQNTAVGHLSRKALKEVSCSSSSNDSRHQQVAPSSSHRVAGACPVRDETSSAYNTGNESCRSTPLKTVGQSAGQCPLSIAGDDGKRDSAVFTLPPQNRRADPAVVHSPCEPGHSRHYSNVAVAQRETVAAGSAVPKVAPPQFNPGVVMYTNPENLQRTILLQQRLLREAMIQQAQHLRAQQQVIPQHQLVAHQGGGPQCSQGREAAVSANWTDNDRLRWLEQQEHGPTQLFDDNQIVKMEWKIKRRADGTRYLARRPIRNKILKERAQKLSSERCGLSTDDDAWSELKTGKYWTREERKKHLERAKERKLRQQDLIKRKAESLRNTSDQPILQLSNKKMLRRQGQQLFDKFTTVQEFLAHGSRTVNGAGRALGILSVTTV